MNPSHMLIYTTTLWWKTFFVDRHLLYVFGMHWYPSTFSPDYHLLDPGRLGLHVAMFECHQCAGCEICEWCHDRISYDMISFDLKSDELMLYYDFWYHTLHNANATARDMLSPDAKSDWWSSVHFLYDVAHLREASNIRNRSKSWWRKFFNRTKPGVYSWIEGWFTFVISKWTLWAEGCSRVKWPAKDWSCLGVEHLKTWKCPRLEKDNYINVLLVRYFLSWNTKYIKYVSHMIHVWYIYLHLVVLNGKCRWIYHTWILWVCSTQNLLNRGETSPKPLNDMMNFEQCPNLQVLFLGLKKGLIPQEEVWML